jgi:hypothetical protein
MRLRPTSDDENPGQRLLSRAREQAVFEYFFQG